MSAITLNKTIMKERLFKFAVFSRLSLLVMQVFFNKLLPDHNADVFKPFHEESEMSTLDNLVAFILGGLKRWDGVYFLHITEYGYTYENTLAFYPLYPLIVRLIANTVLFPLQFIAHYQSVLCLASASVNFVVFVKSACVLFELGQEVLKNDRVAYKGALLFSITPSSIFMSAPYSECLYFYLTLRGLLSLERGNLLHASLMFGMSFVSRSNGSLNICFLLYVLSKRTLRELKRLWIDARINFLVRLTTPWLFITSTFIPYVLLFAISTMPFVLYHWYVYKLYCTKDITLEMPGHLKQYGEDNNLKSPDHEPSSWCNNWIPYSYGYIQSHIWGQGFLKYWQLKQVPNFLLAVPVTMVTLSLACTFFKHNRYTCLTLGYDEVGSAKKSEDVDSLFRLEGSALVPYVLHALSLTVLTRLLFSSCPVLYWHCAHLITPHTTRQKQYNEYDVSAKRLESVEVTCPHAKPWTNLLTNQIWNIQQEPIVTKLILVYFIGYFVIGVLLFSNFLPWT
ncbi:GPI mannosyltransferase 2-like isoform X2 [Dreissena polymorpha]|nr:GPI mannosyltransferase 2-like isoform X2 [Dreissena polymorpha]